MTVSGTDVGADRGGDGPIAHRFCLIVVHHDPAERLGIDPLAAAEARNLVRREDSLLLQEHLAERDGVDVLNRLVVLESPAPQPLRTRAP